MAVVSAFLIVLIWCVPEIANITWLAILGTVLNGIVCIANIGQAIYNAMY